MFDWTPDGNLCPGKFKRLTPLEVLYDFDGPSVFTIPKNMFQRYLVYLCDTVDEVFRYLIVPAERDTIMSLYSGSQALRDALEQDEVWVVDVNKDHIIHTWHVAGLDKIPEDCLPEPGVTLGPR